MEDIKDNSKPKYDLVERTPKFAEDIIDFVKTLPETNITKPLINQLVRAASSVAANYMEADCAESKKDFKHKIGISKKEAKESSLWLRLIARALPDRASDCRPHYKEAMELTSIFSTIVNTCNANDIQSQTTKINPNT